MNKRRATFFAIWALLMAFSLYLALFGTGPFGQSGRPIARLAATDGFVQYRPMDLSVWSDVETRQYFYEGNVLATGDSAKARIVFRGGKVLEIEENTQIVITLDPNGDDLYLVTLLKGSLSAKSLGGKGSASGSVLRIKSRSEEVTLRDKRRKIRLSSLAARKPIATPTPKPLPTIAPTPVPLVSPTPVPKDLAMLRKNEDLLKRLRPSVLYPPAAGKLWTVASLATGNSAKLPVVVSLGPSAGKNGKIDAMLKVSGRGAPRTFRNALLRTSGGKSQMPLDAQLIRSVASATPAGGGREFSLSLTPGAAIKSGSKPVTNYAPRSRAVKMQSLADVGAGPATVSLSGLRYRGLDSGGWFVQSGPAQSSGTAIHLLSGRDLKRIAPYLYGARRFSIKSGINNVKSQGIFIVRGNQVVAKVASASAANWKQLRETLGGHIVYRGDKTAFMRMLGTQEQASWRSLYNIAGTAYLLSGNKIVQINRKLLNENPVAAKFVAQSAKAVFTKPVEILDSGL